MAEEEPFFAVQLADALMALETPKGKSYIEILSQAEDTDQVKLRLRIFDPETWTHQFLPVIFREELRVATREEEGWSLHICRQYMYDEVSKKLRFFWNFIVSSADLKQAIRDLCLLIDMFVVRMGELPPPPPLISSAPIKRDGKRERAIAMEEKEEGDLFAGRGADGAVVEEGRVVSIPLLGGLGRNVPEGGLFEKGKNPKGAHAIGGS